jgi:hypothetical protein
MIIVMAIFFSNMYRHISDKCNKGGGGDYLPTLIDPTKHNIIVRNNYVLAGKPVDVGFEKKKCQFCTTLYNIRNNL